MRHSQRKTAYKSLAPIIVASSVGTLIEWYDFFIFGSLSTIISTVFFPKGNPVAAFLATLATFSAGLLVRPLGALFFGRLGDLIGRKYTFMFTLVLMGGSTIAIGLVPAYETIGFFAPLIVLILRLFQGLAIGGEYGGAATFVAEQSPVNKRGYWTSWIQSTSPLAFILSMAVIVLTKSSMEAKAWESWGWRIPFLVSILMVGISVYIRKNMAESPLFAKAKAEGKTSSNPLKESFGNKANLKIVLLAFLGLTLGTGTMGWTGFYTQSFLVKIMFVDFDQANTVVINGILLGIPFFIFFGWLSDRIGRKYLLVISLLLGALCSRPIFSQMYQVINLRNKVENRSANIFDIKRQLLPGGDSLIVATIMHFYTDGTICREEKTEVLYKGKPEKTEIVKIIKINNTDKRTLVLMIFLLEFLFAISFGPIAAYMVEMFPLKIRYTSLSLPYHLGYGIFGGMGLLFATYFVEKAKEANNSEYYLAGLTYPIVLMSVSLVIGLLYLKESKDGQPEESVHYHYFNKIKRMLGFVWILLGIVAAYFGFFRLGIPKIMSGNQDDIIFGIIMMAIITPVASISLLLFGKYALQGEYDSKVLV